MEIETYKFMLKKLGTSPAARAGMAFGSSIKTANDKLIPYKAIAINTVEINSELYGLEVWRIISRRKNSICILSGQPIIERYHYAPVLKLRPEPNHRGRKRRISVSGMRQLFGRDIDQASHEFYALADLRAKWERNKDDPAYADMRDPDTFTVFEILAASVTPPYYCTEQTRAAT